MIIYKQNDKRCMNYGKWYLERNDVTEKTEEFMGWLMGLEPTTTGITIRDSTN